MILTFNSFRATAKDLCVRPAHSCDGAMAMAACGRARSHGCAPSGSHGERLGGRPRALDGFSSEPRPAPPAQLFARNGLSTLPCILMNCDPFVFYSRAKPWLFVQSSAYLAGVCMCAIAPPTLRQFAFSNWFYRRTMMTELTSFHDVLHLCNNRPPKTRTLNLVPSCLGKIISWTNFMD